MNKKPEFTTLVKLTIEQYLSLHKLTKVKSWRRRTWVKLIENGNVFCAITNKKLAYVGYDKNRSGKSFHYNFYSEDGSLLTLDHIIPKSKKGKNNIDNIQVLCKEINSMRQDIDFQEFKKYYNEQQQTRIC